MESVKTVETLETVETVCTDHTANFAHTAHTDRVARTALTGCTAHHGPCSIKVFHFCNNACQFWPTTQKPENPFVSAVGSIRQCYLQLLVTLKAASTLKPFLDT